MTYIEYRAAIAHLSASQRAERAQLSLVHNAAVQAIHDAYSASRLTPESLLAVRRGNAAGATEARIEIAAKRRIAAAGEEWFATLYALKLPSGVAAYRIAKTPKVERAQLVAMCDAHPEFYIDGNMVFKR